jgi:zinc protease
VRKLVLALLLSAAALPLAPSLSDAQRAELDKMIHRRVLKNGLEIIVVENHGVPLVTVEADVKNGSFTQSPEYAGLAHMYEHMFFKANQEYPEPEAFIDRVSELGAIFNGTTSEEVVNYYVTLHADSLEGGVRFLASALRYPLFRQDELDREKEVVLGEYDRDESSPFFGLIQSMNKKLYPGHFSRKNTIGDREVLRTVTPEKMRVIQKKYYVPNNTAIVIAGDVEPERAFKVVTTVLEDWDRAPDPFKVDPIPAIPALTGDDAVINEAAVGAVTILIQWQGPSVGTDPGATYAADVFSDALNAPTSGFQQRLVDSGLWQSVGVNYYTLNNKGPISISGQVTPDRLRDAMKALDAEIARFDDPNYFTLPQLSDVERHRAVDTQFGQERASGFAHTVGFWWSVASLEYYMGYVDNMAKQKPAELRNYARTYIVGKPRIVGVLISPADRRAIRLTNEDLIRRGVAP